MDMSFAFNQPMVPAGREASLADIMAAAAVWHPAAPVRAGLPVPQRVRLQRDRDDSLDPVGTLARVIVSGAYDSVESARLGAASVPVSLTV